MKEAKQPEELKATVVGSCGGINRSPSPPFSDSNSCALQNNGQGFNRCSHPSSASNVPPRPPPPPPPAHSFPFLCHSPLNALQQSPPPPHLLSPCRFLLVSHAHQSYTVNNSHVINVHINVKKKTGMS